MWHDDGIPISSISKASGSDFQAAAYFISLLICDLIQSIASIMNAQWIRDMTVEIGTLCVVRGSLAQQSRLTISKPRSNRNATSTTRPKTGCDSNTKLRWPSMRSSRKDADTCGSATAVFTHRLTVTGLMVDTAEPVRHDIPRD
ncbi:hypothetical protein DFH09DRAFT_1143521, partial [Mycena vulgaris]